MSHQDAKRLLFFRNPMSAYRVRYQTLEFGQMDIHLRSLRNHQEFSDQLGEAESLGISSANWSLFGLRAKSWPVICKILILIINAFWKSAVA